MNAKSIFYTLLLSVIVSSTNAERMIRMIFNNGISPAAATFCSTTDSAKIDNVFLPILQRVRYLREASSATANYNVTSASIKLLDAHGDRELWPLYCKDNCAGYVRGTCRATNCVGYRKKNRRQMQTFTCGNEVQTLNAKLDDLMKNVSSTCAVYLTRSNRMADCFDDVIYGVVENFVLWKSQSTRKNEPLISLGTVANGFTVCHNDRINIEAVVNPCVDFVNATLTHPGGYTVSRTEGDMPYTVFGDDMNIPLGRELPALGTYTFTAIPDNFDYKKTSLTFQVVQC